MKKNKKQLQPPMDVASTSLNFGADRVPVAGFGKRCVDDHFKAPAFAQFHPLLGSATVVLSVLAAVVGPSLRGAQLTLRSLPRKTEQSKADEARKQVSDTNVINRSVSLANPSFALPRFEEWPSLPPDTNAASVPFKPIQPVGKPVVSATVRDGTLYSFRAENLELKSALALFARANRLNIVPDQNVTGTITVDLSDLPLEKILQALLESQDLTWKDDDGLIRVTGVETRMYTVDYLRLIRSGIGTSSATLSSASSGGAGGGAGGGGGGGGGAGGGDSGGGGGGNINGSSVNLRQNNTMDFWKDLQEDLSKIISPLGQGQASLVINKISGIIQVTDRPSALKRVERFLENLSSTVHRQVDIECKLYDVTLNDQFQFGIDWVHVAAAYGGTLGFGSATHAASIGGAGLQEGALSGLKDLNLGGGTGFNSVVFKNGNTAAAIQALQQQGNVEVIAQPRLRAMNNQTALIKVGTETPFFSETFQTVQTAGASQTFSGDTVTTITVGTILSITPQISADDWITMDISPVLTSLVATKISPNGSASAPVLDTKQASTLVRIRSGTTIVLGGLIQSEHAKNLRKVPVLGDIPLIGKLFTGTFDSKVKKELVIFLTPTIVR